MWANTCAGVKPSNDVSRAAYVTAVPHSCTQYDIIYVRSVPQRRPQLSQRYDYSRAQTCGPDDKKKINPCRDSFRLRLGMVDARSVVV